MQSILQAEMVLRAHCTNAQFQPRRPHPRRRARPGEDKLDDPNHYVKRHHDYQLERIGIAEPSACVVHGEELNLD